MLSIRLSDDEFRQLKSVCEVRGARSVSDLARAAMLDLSSDPCSRFAGISMRSRIEELDARLSILQHEVSRLTLQLGARTCG